MARKLRLESAEGIYHMLNRGNYRAPIFRADKTKPESPARALRKSSPARPDGGQRFAPTVSDPKESAWG